ncbi:MAG: DTW domain-containing protein [Chitinivibrionales bacterium]|nr:DTW domain-containing protein [Chitinivibrionales bacterium]
MDIINQNKMASGPVVEKEEALSRRCAECRQPADNCFCGKIKTFFPSRKVVILQHPREGGKPLNSALLTHKVLGNSLLKVGLSWRNLAHLLHEKEVDQSRWGVLFFKKDDISEKPLEIFDRHKKPVEDKTVITGIIILDGTWKQAKTLWWRNPWLLKLHRIQCNPRAPSLRKQVIKGYLSTAEAVGFALIHLGEEGAIGEGLLDQYRRFIRLR